MFTSLMRGVTDAAITSLNEPNDRGRVAEWIRAFLQKGLEAGLDSELLT